MANKNPSRRHQVFELPKVELDITEYQIFHGRCARCHTVSKGELPADAPSGQMGPRLASLVVMLHGQHPLSLRKTQSLLNELYHFSIGALSEIQGRVSTCLTVVSQAIKKLRGSVIMRKISYGTNSDRGESYRSRVISVVETCKKRSKSIWETLTKIVSAVFTGKPYPDVFNFDSS